jgi:hypothetical protein
MRWGMPSSFPSGCCVTRYLACNRRLRRLARSWHLALPSAGTENEAASSGRSRGSRAGASSTTCSTLRPSTPGAPLFRNTFSNACARLLADATDSINRLSTAVQVAGSIRPLPFAVCTKNRFPSDSSCEPRALSPCGLSANTKANCRGSALFNPSPPLLRWLSPTSLLIRGNPTSPWASDGRSQYLPSYRLRGPKEI